MMTAPFAFLCATFVAGLVINDESPEVDCVVRRDRVMSQSSLRSTRLLPFSSQPVVEVGKRVLFGPSCAPPAGVSPLRRHLRLAILPRRTTRAAAADNQIDYDDDGNGDKRGE